MKTHYELLAVSSDAPSDEIKRAFRREIARYHPDKVQHLGPEFQVIAAERAAELTEAYRVLMDASLRATYDDQLQSGVAPAPRPAGPETPPAAFVRPSAGGRTRTPPPKPRAEPPPPEPTTDDRQFHRERQTGGDFVRREAIKRMRAAIASTLEAPAPLGADGFELSYEMRGRRGLFKKGDPNLRVLARFVPKVDAAAVHEAWPLAVTATTKDATVCVFLMGTGFADRAELTAAITDERRQAKPLGPLVLVPLDVRDWDHLVPTDAPAAVRTIIDRLRKPG